jgi:predicted porin
MTGARRLLSTTAIAALGMAVATGAWAQDRKPGPIQLGLGGYLEIFFGFVSQDDGAGQGAAGSKDHGIVREGEIHFTGSSVLDNGLTVGVKIELEALTSADQIDETYVYFESRFGELRIGQDDAASNTLSFGTPTVVPSFSASDANLTIFTQPGASSTNSVPIANPGDFVGDSEKVIYFSPRIYGLQVGVSYTPDATETGTPRAGQPPLGLKTNADTQSEVVDIAANYIREFKGVEFGLMGGYAKGRAENRAASVAGRTDRTEWGVNGYISFAGVKVGGAYKNDDNGLTGRNDRDAWAAGATYEFGSWGFGVEYARETVETGATPGEDEVNAFLLGARYTAGPGIDLSSALLRQEFKDSTPGAANQNEGWAIVFGTNVRF